MATKTRQLFITELVSKALCEDAKFISFNWLVNKHHLHHFQGSYNAICNIYSSMGGMNPDKRITTLSPDAYFAGDYNFIFEFDEFQHFTTARLNTFAYYPKGLKLNYSVDDWVRFCNLYSHKADKYRYKKTCVDFNFEGGRICGRAYFDCFRDLLPQYHGLNPTLRISEFEVADITSFNTSNSDKIKRLLDSKLKYFNKQ